MINYVSMEERHIDGLAAVEKECFNSGSGRSIFEKELSNKIAYYLVAEENGAVIGYAGLWNMCGSADIMNIGVLKNFRRRGIAWTLLRNLEEFCRREGIFEINLEVRVGNEPARRLYEKMGYKEVAVRKGYYDGKEDGVFMKKILTEEQGK